jgi:hypothetical protein
MADTAQLEYILSFLTVVLVCLTIALVVLGYRAENRLDKLIDVLLVQTGGTVERTLEISSVEVTGKIEDVIFDLGTITTDAHVEAGLVEDRIVVSYRLSWESTVYEILCKYVDAKRLPKQIFSDLAK